LGLPPTISYDAAASLHKWGPLEKKRAGDVQMFGSTQVWTGTLAGCIRQYLGKPPAERHLYNIMVDDAASTRKTILDAADIEAIGKRDDLPTC
jgi:hypothetical protein